MSLIIKYSDLSIGAKESFDVSTQSNSLVSNLGFFKKDAIPQRYDIPFELNSIILDGEAEFLPEDQPAEIGFISEQISDINGYFQTPIVLGFSSSETISTIGLMLNFDSAKNIYATNINIKWYNGEELLDEEDFYPTEPIYFCNKKIQFYNKFIITIYSINLPYNRFRLNGIEYGLKVEFGADEIKSAKIIQEIDPISTTVPINPFDFTINSKKGIEFSFQTRQPIELIFNGEKRAKTFVKSAKRKSKTTWSIQSEDYIGLMETIYFKGGIYVNKLATVLLEEIFEVAKVPYEISSGFENIRLRGYIPYTSCRNALMQVLFAMGAVADTSNSDKINVFKLSETVSQTITKRRIMRGQNFEDDTNVTAVELYSHAYSNGNKNVILYDASQSGIGNDILVVYPEPIFSWSIEGEVVVKEFSETYAIIDVLSVDGKMFGTAYEHTKTSHRKENPNVLKTDIENVIVIENATLVSWENVDTLLNLCYNYLVNTKKVNMKIIDGKNEKSTTVGDLIEFETEYLGNLQGRIIKQSYSLSGGILVKDSEVR